MKTLHTISGLTGVLLAFTLTGCAPSDPVQDSASEMMASLEAKVPTRDRASVRICESLLDSNNKITTFEQALQFAMDSLTELKDSSDPEGMKSALTQALIGIGDSASVGDQAAYATAGMNFATVCTNIVSGEYGK